MEQPIVGKNLQIIKNCELFARKFLILPETIQYIFEECPSQKFQNMSNCSETDGRVVYFNRPWFENSVADHQDDLEFYIFHELRHVHQLTSVRRMVLGADCQDPIDVVMQWKTDFEHYIRNVDAETQSQNLVQEVEQDANGYALSLVNLYYISNGITNPQFRFSLPQSAYVEADTRSREYYKSKPELRQYIEQHRQESSRICQPRRNVIKIGRNDLCPCGSGKKYKKCCMRKENGA